MATHNTYLAYKRETQYLLYWMIHASNSIIKSLPSREDIDDSLFPNATGQTTVSGLVSMSKLIAKHMDSVPTLIYRLLTSVIEARTSYFSMFQQMASDKSDPEIEKSNASHKYFIDALTQIFRDLGGETWEADRKSGDAKTESEDTIEDIIFFNKFSTLGISKPEKAGEEDGDEDDKESDQEAHAPSTTQKRQPRPGKGKKGKKGKKPKKKQIHAAPKESNLDDVPLESYRIIEDKEGIATDYLMAIYALWTEWADLRSYLQGIWREVAYNGLNSAVAGELSNLAIAMVKRTESAVFVDFPGHESYETVMQTITRGNVENAQGKFSLQMYSPIPDPATGKHVIETDVDIKEQLLIHAYRDLFDFATDFQKTRSGKPTNSMMAEIRPWYPYFNLQNASKDERLKWRRSYTINWLYDLVNVFSSVVVQRNTMKGEHHAYERVDWSIHGPWNKHRRLFGLNEFAGFITSLAMQKPGTDIRQKILPHHVFQLQCIVDSLAVSRGWSINGLRGHILDAPAHEFRPRRDVDLFLDRENERKGSGYLGGAHALEQMLAHDAARQGDVNRYKQQSELLELIKCDFIEWLGESKYMHGLTTIPPSRFSSSNSNGLWEFSPFLCAVGLVEGLELSYAINMILWDQIPEPIMLIHLHNMLVQKGYITKPVGLFATLQDLYTTAFFAEGEVPSSNFSEAFADRVKETSTHRATFERRSIRRTAARTGVDIHAILDLEGNRFFKTKPYLMLYRQADWNIERIPEKDIEAISMLSMLRLSQAKSVVDPVTGKRRLEDTDLVRRSKAAGMDDDTLLGMSSSIERMKSTADGPIPKELMETLSDGYKFSNAKLNSGFKGKWAGGHTTNKCKDLDISGRELLELLRWDIFREICADRPLLSLNYAWVTIVFIRLFTIMEDKLKETRNPLYVQAYEEARGELRREKRLGLVMLALSEQDDECLKIMAEVFQNPRAGFMNHIYWEDLEQTSVRMKRTHQSREKEQIEPDQCAVM
ncbi:hypothetical protein F4781DRAFT_175854 [Annulohypoxylon bovei var. microspora]|nr:hypothetical protein F4781DRAFT_175854 [Annulohypoxylon bovei var. microspora]